MTQPTPGPRPGQQPPPGWWPPGQGPPGPAQGGAPVGFRPYVAPPGQSAATTSLVCGIVGLALVVFCCLGPAALPLGIVAVRHAAKARRQASSAGTREPSNAGVGRGLGIASIVLGSLATVALVVVIVVMSVGFAHGWFDTGQRPEVVACEARETATEVTVVLIADGDRRLTYHYTVEVRDRADRIAQVDRTVSVRGVEQETVVVPLPNGRTCRVTDWWTE